LSTTLLVLFVGCFTLRVFFTRPHMIAALIEDDIKQIVLMMKKIDARCSILNISSGREKVNFLTVKSFSPKTSQVGPLNLAHPKNWEGPYLHIDPTFQEKHYEIVMARDGLYVLPGQGVTLPNGLVLGKDFLVNRWTPVEA